MNNGEDFRNDLRNALGDPGYKSTLAMFEYVYRLFEQATRSFETKSYEAVCLLCRSTVEAACYIYLTRKKGRVGREIFGTLSNPPRKLDGAVRTIPFPELQSAIRNGKVLSDQQLRNLDRIKSDGDLIAHIAEKADRLIWGSLRKDPNKNPLDVLPSMGENEASKDLEDTVSIITTLAKQALKDASGPLELDNSQAFV